MTFCHSQTAAVPMAASAACRTGSTLAASQPTTVPMAADMPAQAGTMTFCHSQTTAVPMAWNPAIRAGQAVVVHQLTTAPMMACTALNAQSTASRNHPILLYARIRAPTTRAMPATTAMMGQLAATQEAARA